MYLKNYPDTPYANSSGIKCIPKSSHTTIEHIPIFADNITSSFDVSKDYNNVFNVISTNKNH